MRMRTDRTGATVSAGALAVGVLLSSLAGCTATQKVKVEEKPAGCAMLAPDVCQNLVAVVGENRAGLRYMASGVNWSQYTKVLISPVAFYGGSDSKVSAADQQELTNYMYQALVKAVGEKFPLVETPGPGVMRLQVALTDVAGATPGLRTVSMVIPQARALATLKYVATGTYPFVGSAEGEVRVTDSVTGKTLAAAMDRRVGGGSITTAAQWTMGDAEDVMKKWAELTALRLSQLQQGTFTSSDK
jgi:Protein of unknown function (DUF3313)